MSYRGSFIARHVEPLVYLVYSETTHVLLMGVTVLLGLTAVVAYFTIPDYGPRDGETLPAEGCLLGSVGRHLKASLL